MKNNADPGQKLLLSEIDSQGQEVSFVQGEIPPPKH